MKNYKVHIGISLASFVLGIGILVLLIFRVKILTGYLFLIYGMLAMILIANLASLITVLWCNRKQLTRKNFFTASIYFVINILFILLCVSVVLMIHLAF